MSSLTETLLGPAWYLPVAALVLAGIVLLFGLVRRDKAARAAGAVALALAAIWLIAASVVVTHRESALAQTRAAVEAYDDADWPALDAVIDDDTRFDNDLVGGEIVRAAEATHDALAHSSVDLATIDAEQSGGRVTVDFEVVSLQGGPVPRLRTAWRFEFARRDGQTVLDRITILPTEQIDPEQIRGQIVRR